MAEGFPELIKSLKFHSSGTLNKKYGSKKKNQRETDIALQQEKPKSVSLLHNWDKIEKKQIGQILK